METSSKNETKEVEPSFGNLLTINGFLVSENLKVKWTLVLKQLKKTV